MSRWPIERRWVVRCGHHGAETLTTSELSKYPACCMQGAAGLGKTCELHFLKSVERSGNADGRYERLAFLATSAESLELRLTRLVTQAAEGAALYLDALDEAMVTTRTAGLVLTAWIGETLSRRPIRIRLSSRSAVWPDEVTAALQEAYGRDAVAIATLQPLSRDDVREVAKTKGLDPDEFLTAISRAGATTLAQQPLTLELLLGMYGDSGQIPPTRRELFAAGVDRLSRERWERRDLGTVPPFPPADILEAAERLACLAMFSGRDAVDLGDAPQPTTLGWEELSSLPATLGRGPLDEGILRAVATSGLCEGDGPGRFRFIHRQFAEYLAGRRVASLLPHQAKALLASPQGWTAGVAGPLRETAAFAAMHSDRMAEWVAATDPEVIGLSDVADDDLRRRALLGLFEKFRRRELTDVQVSHDEITLDGFRYNGAEQDLAPVLRERGKGIEDLLQCAIKVVESWELATMGDDLAEVFLDVSAPRHVRVSAGYALLNLGSPEARHRTKSMVTGTADDPDQDLRGLALRCNWPGNLSTPELFAALVPRTKESHYGAYDSFLSELAGGDFDARGHRAAGLAWARRFVRRWRGFDAGFRIALRIAHAAVNELDDPAVAASLADLIITAAQAHEDSPLEELREDTFRGEGEVVMPAPLLGKQASRRRLIEALTSRKLGEHDLWLVTRQTPGLLVPEDFIWLLHRAVDPTVAIERRTGYAELANAVRWTDKQEYVDAWLAVRDVEPVKSEMNYPLLVELDGAIAMQARRQHAAMRHASKPIEKRRLDPPPHERVRQVLGLAETKDVRFFFNLCSELTLKDDSDQYEFERFLTATPGWQRADQETRDRIVRLAKQFLLADTDAPEKCRTAPANSILPGYMSALWLALEVDPLWVEELPTEWWERWAWYLIRELRPHMNGESGKPKAEIARLLHARAPGAFAEVIASWAMSLAEDARDLLRSGLEAIEALQTPLVDQRLCDALESRTVPGDRVGELAEYMLCRNPGRALPLSVTFIDPTVSGAQEGVAVRTAVAVLAERMVEGWDHLFSFMRARPDLAKRVLENFSHDARRTLRRSNGEPWFAKLTSAQVGDLLLLLIEHFPYDSDPQHDSMEMRRIEPDDSARQIRTALMNWLCKQGDAAALVVLRGLEKRLGDRHPWLRRPRADAERAFRLTHWGPIPPASVAALLASESKRLLRGGADVVEGIVEALQEYERSLHHKSPAGLEDLWNIPKGAPPTPKAEERASDKLCEAIRQYFERYTVTADREVQVFRRKVPRSSGGLPGSELDVLARVPAPGSTAGDEIAVPVEVKLSGNPEATTGLTAQLLVRYMRELGTSFGVFVVVWIDAPGLPRTHRPRWRTIDAARSALSEQVDNVSVASRETTMVRSVVIDASIRVVGAGTPPQKKAKTARRLRAASSTKRRPGRPAVTRAGTKTKTKTKTKATTKNQTKTVSRRQASKRRPSKAKSPPRPSKKGNSKSSENKRAKAKKPRGE